MFTLGLYPQGSHPISLASERGTRMRTLLRSWQDSRNLVGFYFSYLAMVAINYRPAAAHTSLMSGRATSARIIESSNGIRIAGNYAAWQTGNKLYWQRLSFKEDGSIFPAKQLQCSSTAVGPCIFLVNPDGYFLLEQRNSRYQSSSVCIIRH